MRSTTGLLVAVTTAAALLAGCGSTATPEPAAGDTTAAPFAVASPTAAAAPGSTDPAGAVPAAPSDGPPFPRGTKRQLGDSTGPQELVFTGIRTGAHDGFDRVVLEFSGEGTPGWSVQYQKRARLDGSGDPVRLDGDSVLDAFASGTTWLAPGYYQGPDRLPAVGPAVAEVFVGGTFEGYTQILLGIAGDRTPFRVFPLTDPPRLVVDVRS